MTMRCNLPTGVGEHGNVAAIDLLGAGVHTFRQDALQLGLDGGVLLSRDVLARLRLPSCTFHLLVKEICGRHAPCRLNDPLVLLVQVSREESDSSGAEPYAPVCDLDMREDFCGGEFIKLCEVSSLFGASAAMYTSPATRLSVPAAVITRYLHMNGRRGWLGC